MFFQQNQYFSEWATLLLLLFFN